MSRQTEQGFTAVELLVTLFVAAAFLIASYQLFNLVIKDGGATRAESRASNVAYNYMRKYGASATTIPCTASNPLNASPVSVDGLTNVTVDVTVSCVLNAPTSLSQVKVAVHYNVPQQTVVYSTFTNANNNPGSTDITNGLVAWWKLNGDATTAVGSPNGVINGAVSTTNKSGQQNMAYQFDGSSSTITSQSTYGLTGRNSTVSLWVNNPTATNSGAFINIGDGTNGFGIGIGAARYDNSTPGTKLDILFENVRWISSTTNVGTGWHYVVLTLDGSGTAAAYIDGVAAGGITSGAAPTAPSGSGAITAFGGSPAASARYFNGSVDDVRLYNRVLSLSEIVTLNSNGPK